MVQTNSLNFAIVVCGPTGSGKTKLAIALANKFNGEIISADSIAIYKGLNIGTAKPTKEELSLAVHHMIDVAMPTQEFSVAEYKQLGRNIMFDIISRGKVPIICGGTGYYIDALLYDFSYGNCPKDDQFRQKCQIVADTQGVEVLYQKLLEIDPITAEQLHSNDKMRIIRALEIYHTTGLKKSQIVDDKKSIIPFYAYSYDYDRQTLYDRINWRVDKMFEQGLVDEVKNLLLSGVDKDSQSMQGIGYKEVVLGLEENWPLNQIAELIKLNTRHYAKRQITWFKRLENIKYLVPDNLDNALELIKEDIYGNSTDKDTN